MKEEFTAVMKRSGAWWIGWVAEVPGVNCQERTKEALLETLKVTLREALELNRHEASTPPGKASRKSPSRYEAQGTPAASAGERMRTASRRRPGTPDGTIPS